MSAPNYQAPLDALEAILKADAGLRAVANHITQDEELPSADQCPAIIIVPVQVPRNPIHLVSGLSQGAFRGAYHMRLDAWVFSGQSIADARRQRAEFVTLLENCLQVHPTLGNAVQIAVVTNTRFGMRGTDAGLYALAQIDLEAQLLF